MEVPDPTRQMELLPRVRRTAQQRKEWIRERLRGLEYRQAEREERRRAVRDRQRMDAEAAERQMTIASILDRPSG